MLLLQDKRAERKRTLSAKYDITKELISSFVNNLTGLAQQNGKLFTIKYTLEKRMISLFAKKCSVALHEGNKIRVDSQVVE